ncbi:hypothetical protein B0O99DRAFT_695223 [Bisporella sp. PMI_857]|nr:hypothetical protein B0O99DRAFT_695223 [Bisporella sp. PMI_857]
MGVDCGFDIYPPLERTNANREKYELLLRTAMMQIGVTVAASCVLTPNRRNRVLTSRLASINSYRAVTVVRDKARAKVFAERAYAARKVLAGDENPTTIEFKHFAKQPVDYHLYGKRMKCYDDSREAPRGIYGEELENWLWNTDG